MTNLNESTNQQTARFAYIDELENYHIIEKIGSGTYGIVHKAQRKNMDKIVALKQILISKKDEGFPATSVAEICILQKLIHENIVHLIGLCQSPRKDSCRKDFYLIFEYCDYDLANIIKDNRITFTFEQKKSIINQTLDGLYFLHNNDIVHRDLKPANILMTKEGILKLADFGLSKIMRAEEGDQKHHDTNQYVSRWYRAPELLLGDSNYGMAIDLWSAGCIFAELWTRTPILRGEDELHQLLLIRKLCGNIDWPGVENLSYHRQYKSSENKNPEPKKFLSDYRSFVQQQCAIGFIDELLTVDPNQRMKINTAVKSEFLQPKPSPDILKPLISSL